MSEEEGYPEGQACCLTHHRGVKWQPWPAWWQHADHTSCLPMIAAASPTAVGLYWLRRGDVRFGSLGAQRQLLAAAMKRRSR